MENKLLKIFIGYDPVESVAWHTMAHSIFTRSSRPVSIIPLSLGSLRSIFTRKRDDKQSNEFSYTRFLVPYLCDYKGYAIFFDCDMLLQCDVSSIFEAVISNPGKACYVVKHNYEPKNKFKYLGAKQYSYPRKNWSSVIVWNCEHLENLKLSLDYVNTSPGSDLHRFAWLNDDEIGELDVSWNWLVGEYDKPQKNINNFHWTIGGPYFNEYSNSDFSDYWFEEYLMMKHCKQKDNL
jgi:hypothetical protein